MGCQRVIFLIFYCNKAPPTTPPSLKGKAVPPVGQGTSSSSSSSNADSNDSDEEYENRFAKKSYRSSVHFAQEWRMKNGMKNQMNIELEAKEPKTLTVNPLQKAK